MGFERNSRTPDTGNPFQADEDLLDDEVSLLRRIFALRDAPDLMELLADMLRFHEGPKADVSRNRLRGFVKESDKRARRGQL